MYTDDPGPLFDRIPDHPSWGERIRSVILAALLLVITGLVCWLVVPK